jgi:large subunit ribosomal protein L25
VSEVRIAAESRTEFGKGAARRVRRADKVPAVLYGHGEAPQHIALPGHELMLALKHSNALLEIDMEGTRKLALPKDVQRDPIKGFLEHVDLVVVRRGEKVTVEVAVHTTGDAAPETLVTMDHTVIEVEAEATHIPDSFEVSIEDLPAGTQILAREVPLPSGSTLVTDPEALVVNITAAPTAEQVDAELAEAEAEVGIEHEAPEDEAAAGEAPAEGATESDAESGGESGEGSPQS